MDAVYLDVGGEIFKTSKSTLTQHSEYFRIMFDPDKEWAEKGDTRDNAIFIDRNPDNFRQILNWLRDQRSPIERDVLFEFEYFQIDVNFDIGEDVYRLIVDASLKKVLLVGDIAVPLNEGECKEISQKNICFVKAFSSQTQVFAEFNIITHSPNIEIKKTFSNLKPMVGDELLIQVMFTNFLRLMNRLTL